MKKGLVISILFLFLAGKVAGQTKVYIHKNPFERTFTKVQTNPMFGADSSALKSYLTQKLRNQIPETLGELKVSLLIDSTGKPLCHWIENRSNLNIETNQFRLIFENMPNWNPGIVAKHSVNCAVILSMMFNGQKLLVQCKTGTH